MSCHGVEENNLSRYETRHWYKLGTKNVLLSIGVLSAPEHNNECFKAELRGKLQRFSCTIEYIMHHCTITEKSRIRQD